MAHQKLPLGTSDFKTLIDERLYYVDKTNMIADLINGSRTTLIPRPRRFGKTLNMSMLNYFFSNHQDYRYLFDGLAISDNAEAMKHCGQYPVIFLSFKDVKQTDAQSTFNQLSYLIAEAFDQHREILDSLPLTEIEAAMLQSIRTQTASKEALGSSIKILSQLIARYYQKPVIILIDEYDMPINSAYTYGFYDELVFFLRNLLSGAFKDNPVVFKGVLTGILRIARESIFSGLNNVDVCTLTSPRYAPYFGFSENETEQLLKDYELTYEIDAIRTWYNGYNVGEHTIYNPWSIISLALNNGAIAPYWLNTSDNALVRDLIARASPLVKQELEALLIDKSAVVRKPLNENIVFRDIDSSDDSIWNFLLFSGYLSYTKTELDQHTGITYVNMMLPNQEVRHFYITTILDWFKSGATTTPYDLSWILNYLLKLEFDSFCEAFEQFAEDCFSYFDVTGKASESFYHAFVLGMLVQLQPTHAIKSNRESGFGRYDVCLIPHDKSQTAFVFEFKKVSKRQQETLETACAAALQQIEKKQYVTELQALGIESVYPIAIAFESKQAMVVVASEA